jgi:hypothetical protein
MGGKMSKSDLSLEDLKEDEAVKIRVMLEDGDGRELRVSKEEAQALTTRGTAISPWYTRVGRSLYRPLAWLVALLIGSLLIPGVTKQWTDRPKELELKNSLVKQITESTTHAIEINRINVGNALPETIAYYDALSVWRQAAPKDKPAALQSLKKASAASRKAKQQVANEVYSTWQTNRALIGAQLQAYFPNTRLASDWSGYANAIYNFGQLGTSICMAARQKVVEQVRDYFNGNPRINWSALLTPTADAQCQDDFVPPFQNAYGSLANELVIRREPILDEILSPSVHASGYSSGWRDLLRDIRLL